MAIDGPSGSGKSTTARKLAQELQALYIDTGAMYRAVALALQEKNLCPGDGDNSQQPPSPSYQQQMRRALSELQFSYGLSPHQLIVLDGKNLTQKIRQHFVSELASRASQSPPVREYLVSWQRKLAHNRLCVMEGRDIGTVVFPHAFIKFFLCADTRIRTQRRSTQLQIKDEREQEQIYRDIMRRDEEDAMRSLAPLKQAKDAVLVDNTHLGVEDVVSQLKRAIVARAKQLGIKLCP